MSSVAPGGAADKAGIQPGDVIIEFNGRPGPKSDDLVKMVAATKPGTQVPVKVMRDKQRATLNVTVDELDLEAEQTDAEPQQRAAGAAGRAGEGFGLTLQDLTPRDGASPAAADSGRPARVITDVDPDSGPSAGALRPGDVILP